MGSEYSQGDHTESREYTGMTGEVLVLTRSCKIVKHVFQQGHSEQELEAYNLRTLRACATR